MSDHFLKCFVRLPPSEEFKNLFDSILVPIINSLGYEIIELDTRTYPMITIREILNSLYNADLIIFELTHIQPNLLYELGIIHTLGKPTIILTQDSQDLPFDFQTFRITYGLNLKNVMKLEERLVKTIKSIQFDKTFSSPIREFLPDIYPPIEMQRVQDDLKNANNKLKEYEDTINALKSELKIYQDQKLSAEDLVKEFIQNTAVRELQRELVKKEQKMNELSRIEEGNIKLLEELKSLRLYLHVKPHWGMPKTSRNDKYVFVLMPFREEWSDIVWEIVKSTTKDLGLICERADDKTGKFVMQDIWDGISAASIVIADLTEGNPNVTYEVGMCDILGKEQILLAQNPKEIPFDFLGVRLLPYSYVHGGIAKLKSDLKERINHIMRASGR